MSAYPRLERTLRTADGLAVVVGIMIGSGIFRTPGIVAAHLGRPSLTFVAWALGGLVGLGAAAVFTALLMPGFDATAQDAKKAAPRAASPCRGLDEKACKGKTADCAWVVPSKGKQRPYCRLKPAGKKKG